MLSCMTTIRGCAVLTVGVFLLPPISGLPGVRWVETVSGAGLIAFVRAGSESGIYTIEQSGSGLTRLTDGLPLTTTTRGALPPSHAGVSAACPRSTRSP
jgi:hypothetical protein